MRYDNVLHYYSVNIGKVIFSPHCQKHGITIEEIVYAAEHVIKLDACEYNGQRYLRFTGRIVDTLRPVIEVVMKITTKHIIVVYHANGETDNFFDRPITDWIKDK